MKHIKILTLFSFLLLCIITFPANVVSAEDTVNQESSLKSFKNYDPSKGLVDIGNKPGNLPSIPTENYEPEGIVKYVNNILNVLFPALGIITVLMIVMNAGDMVTYSSNETKAKQAQKGIMWASIGLLATILAYAVITSIIRFVFMATGG